MDQILKKFIKKLRFYLFGEKLVKMLLKSICLASIVAGIMALIAIFIPWYSVTTWETVAFIALLVGGVGFAFWKYPSKREAALRLDATGFEERFVTAMELLGDNSFFANLQKKDAIKHMNGVTIHKRLPYYVPKKQWITSFFLFLVMLVVSVWPSEAKVIASNRHEVSIEAEEIISELEKLEPEFTEEEREELSEIDQELLDEIEQLKEELKDATDQESLDKTTQRVEKKLEQMSQKAENQELRDQLAQMYAQLNNEALPPNQEQQSQLEELYDQLQNLSQKAEENQEKGDKPLSEEELEQLGEIQDQLEELAEQLGNANLSQVASDISQAISNPDKLKPSQIMDIAENLLNSSPNNTTNPDGKPSHEGTSGDPDEDQWYSQDKDEESGDGVGSSNGEASANAGGSSTGNMSGSSSGGQGGTGEEGSGGGWNYGSNLSQEQENTYDGEMVAIPNQTGDDENLTGSQTGGSSFTTDGGPSVTWSGTSVEYSQVLKEYSDKAYAQLDGEQYPSGMQDVVKTYFEELNK